MKGRGRYHEDAERLPLWRLLRCVGQGMTVPEICNRFGVSRALVHAKAKAYRVTLITLAQTTRACQVCETTFTPATGNQTCCSEKCRKQHTKRQKKAQRERETDNE